MTEGRTYSLEPRDQTGIPFRSLGELVERVERDMLTHQVAPVRDRDALPELRAHVAMAA